MLTQDNYALGEGERAEGQREEGKQQYVWMGRVKGVGKIAAMRCIGK